MEWLSSRFWNTFDQDTKDKWVNQLTQLTAKYTHAPLDKVLILIREMIPGNWGQSGVTGADKDFLSKSRTFKERTHSNENSNR
jgi:4-oxalocrotonate tautomerase